MGAVLEDELLGGTAFIHEEKGNAAVRVSEGQISDAGRYVSACLDSHRSGFDHLGGVGKIVVVALAGADCATSGIKSHDTETGRAAARSVWTAVFVQHQIPKGNTLAVVLHGLEENALEVVDEAGFKLVVPSAYGCFREKDFLLRSRRVNAAQGVHGAAVIMPGRAGNKL